MNQTEAIKKAEDRLNLCIHISECSENKGRDKRRSTMSEIERAIECFNNKVWSGELFESEVDMYNAVITVLRSELSRQENAPLTWEELVSMTRKTVYIVDRTDDEKSGWAIVGKQYIKIGLEFITLCENLAFRRELKELYGQTWIAYRHEPKGEPPCTQD